MTWERERSYSDVCKFISVMSLALCLWLPQLSSSEQCVVNEIISFPYVFLGRFTSLFVKHIETVLLAIVHGSHLAMKLWTTSFLPWIHLPNLHQSEKMMEEELSPTWIKTIILILHFCLLWHRYRLLGTSRSHRQLLATDRICLSGRALHLSQEASSDNLICFWNSG